MAEKKLTLEMVARTDTGREREINEDNFLGTSNYRLADWFLPAEPYTDAGSMMVVADGMGGLNAGEVASRITVDSVREFLRQYEKLPASDGAVRNILSKAILYAHKEVVEHSKKDSDTHGMGSTVVIGLVAHRKIHFCWSGDSRGYVFRQGKLRQLTKDHSYVQSLVDEGKLSAEQAHLHPESNVILQSIGDPDRDPQPDYASLPLSDGDVLLLCSDGVNAMVQDAEIGSLLAVHAGNLAQCAEKIVEAANQAGGVDNITVLLSKVVAGAGIVEQPAGTEAATLDPFAQATLKVHKRKGKNRWLIFPVLLLLLTMGFLVAPMIGKRQSTPPPGAPAMDKSTAAGQKKESDSTPPKKHPEKNEVRVPGKGQRTDSTRLTPIDSDKHKELLKKVEEKINEKKPADTVKHPLEQTDRI